MSVLDTEIALPYPVCGRSDDYLGADFQVAFKPRLAERDGSKKILIEYSFDLSDDQINSLIERGDASFGFEIACAGTSRRSIQLTTDRGQFDLNPEEYYDRVVFSPMVFVLYPIDAFKSENFNPEYGDSSYSLAPGDVIAIADDESLVVDYGKLDFSSCISIERSSERNPWTYDFGLDGNSIVIMMGSEMFDFWNSSKDKRESQPFLIMSVYKDCFVAAIDFLIKEDTPPESAWAHAFSSLLEKSDLVLPEKNDFGAMNELAQRLLIEMGPKRAVQQ